MLKAWLKDEGLWLFAGQATTSFISHVFLDGGKASVPLDRMPDFFRVYEKSLSKGDVPCAVERLSRDGVFKMFMDVDLKDFEGDLKSTAEQILEGLPGGLDVGEIIVCK